MSKFLSGLRRLGLVEVDENAAAGPGPEAVAGTTQPDDRVLETPEPPPSGSSEIEENRPFDDIYREHRIPDSPYPAEKLLKVLDGLRALEPAVRRSAVLAIDQADDAWTIDDAVLDAERKIKALEATRAGLQQVVRAAEERGRSEADQAEQRLQDSVTRIRQQISDLEALQAREVAQATQDKARIDAEVRASREACARESARLDAAMAELAAVARAFAPESGVGTQPR